MTYAPAAVHPAQKRLPRAVQPLLEAARALMAEGRLDATPLEQIAQMAGVSRRSLHNHFADREALASRVVAELRLDMSARILDAVGRLGDPSDRLVHGFFTALRYGLQSGVNERVLLRVAPGSADPANPGLAPLVAELRRGEASGGFRLASLDAAVVLVLGLFDFGLGELHRLRASADADAARRAQTFVRELGLVLLQSLRADHRAAGAVVDRALAAVFGAAAGAGLGAVSDGSAGVGEHG